MFWPVVIAFRSETLFVYRLLTVGSWMIIGNITVIINILNHLIPCNPCKHGYTFECKWTWNLIPGRFDGEHQGEKLKYSLVIFDVICISLSAFWSKVQTFSLLGRICLSFTTRKKVCVRRACLIDNVQTPNMLRGEDLTRTPPHIFPIYFFENGNRPLREASLFCKNVLVRRHWCLFAAFFLSSTQNEGRRTSEEARDNRSEDRRYTPLTKFSSRLNFNFYSRKASHHLLKFVFPEGPARV